MFKALLIVLFGATTTWAQPCPMAIPRVDGVDQSPTPRSQWGKCTDAVEASARERSNWCSFGRLTPWPAPPSAAASESLKFGRQTVYRGSILKQKGACNVDLIGSDTHATVAVSSKYLRSQDGGWAANKGACGQCMCVHVNGGDAAYNQWLFEDSVRAQKGLCFMARVGDRCGECPDDSIDVLQDRPYSYAPNDHGDNPNAPIVNRLKGPRGFLQSSGRFSPETTGTWTAEWQFVPCSWTHDMCRMLMESFGYNDTRVPGMTPGRDF